MNEPTLRGLSQVRVHKDYLLEKLRQNRNEHRRLFEDALDGWHKEVLAELQRMMKRAKADKHYQPRWCLPVPQDHTQEYDHIIALLEASLDTEFELSSLEFAQFVQDDWGWKADFLRSTASYTSARERGL